VGRNVSTDYVYKRAYIYQNNAWQPQNLTASTALVSSNWYTSFASVPLPSGSITTSWTYAVGYVCAWNGVAWKCGCADSACTTGHWQLQAFERAAQTTTTGTVSQNSADGSTITPTSGGSLTTSAGQWTFGTAKSNGSSLILINGSQPSGDNGASAVLLLVYNGGNMYQKTAQGAWWEWNGSGWTQIAGDPRGTTTGDLGVPAPAQAAGFTTLALNADFSQSTYSNVANWVDGCGGPTSGFRWIYRWFPSGGGAPCSEITQVADETLGGQQVLHLQYLPAYNSPGTNTNQQILQITLPSVPYGDNNNYLPIEGYTEMTFRYADGLNQSKQVNNSGWFNGGGGGHSDYLEPDFFLKFAPTRVVVITAGYMGMEDSTIASYCRWRWS
jgi:hypothetical protein